MSSNSGYDYLRCYFNMQECGTDELVYTWQEGDKMSGLTYLSWDANDVWVSDTYYRIYYTIALCNEFLRNATDGQIQRLQRERAGGDSSLSCRSPLHPRLGLYSCSRPLPQRALRHRGRPCG